MCKLKLIFIVTVFVLSFSVFAQAQDIPDYLFLEVLDSDKKPVEGAAVESEYVFGSSYKDYEKRGLKTDEKGNAGFPLEGGYYYFSATSLFSVSKDGYFTFNDLGISRPLYRIYRTTAQVELLKIPNTKKEKRFLGNEQQKREFMWAAKTGDAETVKKLLKVGISPNLNTNDLRGVPGLKDVPAIELAANSADSQTVKALIDARVNIRAADEPVRSILATYLRADPFFWHKFKTEAEQKEILRRYEDGAEFLLKAGADFYVEDSNKRKPIMIAAEKGYARAVKMLLDKGFSPNLADEYGTTLLTFAAGDSYPEIKYSKVETINLLLERGADPNLSKNGCGSALGSAASRGDVEAIRALLKAGAKLDSGCKETQSPLLRAVESQKIAAAKLLIEAGADKTAVNRDGENALMTAAKKGSAEMVQMLLDKGFPMNAKTTSGWTALLSALNSYSSPNPDVVKILLKAGANPNVVLENKANDVCLMPLKASTEIYNFDFTKLLIENGANVNLSCSDGETALVYAVSRRNLGAVRQLIRLGADVGGERIEQTMNFIKTLYKEGEYKRKDIDETIKIIEEARAGKKP